MTEVEKVSNAQNLGNQRRKRAERARDIFSRDFISLTCSLQTIKKTFLVGVRVVLHACASVWTVAEKFRKFISKQKIYGNFSTHTRLIVFVAW